MSRSSAKVCEAVVVAGVSNKVNSERGLVQGDGSIKSVGCGSRIVRAEGKVARVAAQILLGLAAEPVQDVVEGILDFVRGRSGSGGIGGSGVGLGGSSGDEEREVIVVFMRLLCYAENDLVYNLRCA